MTIRSHLLVLSIGAVLPVLVFALFASVRLVDREQITVQQGANERARAIMTAVDAELRGSLNTIEALTASPALQAGDLAAFHAEAVRVLATQPSWVDLSLALPSGQKVVDALQPFGSPLGRQHDPASAARVVDTRKPAIGNVDRLDAHSPLGVPVRTRVLRDGEVAYVLTARVRPDSFEELISKQRLPAGWVSGIVDANGRFVARVPHQPAGALASASFRAAVLQAPEGWYRGFTVEGADTYTAYQRSEFSNWSIGLAIPAEIVRRSALQTTWLMGIGVLASIAVASAVAAVIGKRIATPIVSLATVARSIGAGGETPSPISGSVREVEDVALALREADAAVRERHMLIRRERDALEAADRAKNEFIATLSHELRNPLAALNAAAHILRNVEPSNPAANGARHVIDRQSRHMSQMVEELLDMSRLVTGKLQLAREPLDLGQLVANVVDAWRVTGRFAERDVRVDIHPAWVIADRVRTEQIVANLLDNAVKFTSAGKAITIGVHRDDGFATLSVADEGEGVAPELVAHIFDPFVQGEQDVGRARGGMGLGLALVKRLAEVQAGSVSVTSEGRNRGATFVVRLPAAGPSAAGVPLADAPRVASRGSRVLVVEDNADARDMLREVLGMLGHEVRVAADGRSGVDLAREFEPDVAIVDIGLPDVSGYEVARSIRAQSRGRHLALVALTGYGQPEDERRAIAAGFDAYLVKPVAIDQLDETIATVMAGRGLRASTPASRTAD